MAGRPGRSGGWNRIDPKDHLIRGTFNATRHGAALAAQQRGATPWAPADEQLERLGPDGRALVTRLRSNYELTGLEGELCLEAGMAVDRLAEIRLARVGSDLKSRLVFDKTEQLWQRQLSALLLSLRVRP